MLDILLHAHDIQGLGHISRSVAIALALRRLRPAIRLLIVTGAPEVELLCCGLSLDFVKLPSYGSSEVGGLQFHHRGVSNLEHLQIVSLRSNLLSALIEGARPACVLVDHRPMGQCNELLEALKVTRGQPTKWILGMRGVVGEVEGVWTGDARDIFQSYYQGLLWYGDRSMLIDRHVTRLEAHFGLSAIETGYVCRLREMESSGVLRRGTKDYGRAVFAATWCTEATFFAVQTALSCIASNESVCYREWDFFIGPGLSRVQRDLLESVASNLTHVRLQGIHGSYVEAVQRAGFAVVCGGYNSITDILWARTPALILMRQSANQEQKEHLEELELRLSKHIFVVPETMLTPKLFWDGLKLASVGKSFKSPIELDGGERAAKLLLNYVDKFDSRQT